MKTYFLLLYLSKKFVQSQYCASYSTSPIQWQNVHLLSKRSSGRSHKYVSILLAILELSSKVLNDLRLLLNKHNHIGNTCVPKSLVTHSMLPFNPTLESLDFEVYRYTSSNFISSESKPAALKIF